MAFDQHANFGYSTIAVAPAPAGTGTSLQVSAGHGALFPTAPFNCTVWPSGVQPLASNAEIVRVTAVVGDTLTIVRAQEGSSAVAIAVGFQIANTTSRMVFTDIENSIIQFISAGTTRAGASEVIFSNANGISFGADGQTITASVNAGAGLAVSAGANSRNTGTVVFSNANGITFAMDGAGVITASHDGITQQSTQPVAASASNGSFLFSTLGFSNANGITFGSSAGNIITASHNALTSQSNQAASASNGSFTFQTLGFSDANGVTFGTSAGGIITASHNGLTSQSNQAASASNGSFTFQTLNFSNANNVTFGTSAGGIITASVATAAAGASINFSAGTQSSNLASIVFGDSNGISFGLSNGTITASHNGLTSQSNQAASASNGSFTFQTVGFSNANGITFGTSAGSIITASHNAITTQTNPGASASNGSFSFQTLNFSNANNVTFGTSAGGIVTASVNAGGGATLQMFEPWLPVSTGTAGTSIFEQMNQFMIPQHLSMAFGRVMFLMATTGTNATTLASASATASGRTTIGHTFGIYTFGNGASSTSIGPLASGSVAYIWSNSISITNSSQYTLRMGVTYPVSGGTSESTFQLVTSAASYSFNVTSNFAGFSSVRFFDTPCSVSLTPGNYWMAQVLNSTTTSAGALTAIQNAKMIPASIYFINRAPGVFELNFGQTQSSSAFFSAGNISASGGSFHTSVNRTDIQANALNRGVYFQLHSNSV